jgi:8-oxo-dGTP pyrophosphatase MutT (NUDIX family)
MTVPTAKITVRMDVSSIRHRSYARTSRPSSCHSSGALVTYESALRRLEAGLRSALPGPAAQDVFAPRPRREWPEHFNPARIRHAAGLLLLFPRDRQAHVLLTVRTDRLERHGGQVSLPGGVVDPGESFEQTAIREAQEEVGLAPDLVRPLGALTPVDIPVSGFRLHPIAATSQETPGFMPSDHEVARILEVPVAHLMTPATRGEAVLVRGDRTVVAPGFDVEGLHVWGATAMVLAEFLALLGWIPSDPR